MLMGVISVVIVRMMKPDIIYVRNRLIAFGLLTLKPFVSKPIAFKFGGFAADEVLPTIKQKRVRRVIGKLLWIIDYYTLRHADQLLVNSKTMESLIREKSSIRCDKILICPVGVDMEKIVEIKERKASFMKDKVRIGFLGSLTWWQGVDILAEAVAIVKERLPDVELFVVGDGPMRNKVAEICGKHKVKCVITGFVPHEEALRYLRSFDVLVLPSRRTSATEANVPIKVVEAWALGVPVIVTSHEVFKAICMDGEHVVFVRPNPGDVAEKILLLFSDQRLKEKLKRNGEALAQNFDYDKIARRLVDAILQER
jgi:glycosyltransferase involved in cell wall biosynthesis